MLCEPVDNVDCCRMNATVMRTATGRWSEVDIGSQDGNGDDFNMAAKQYYVKTFVKKQTQEINTTNHNS